MPIPAELAPALRHLSVPLIAVAEAWPFGRDGRIERRRLSICPDPSAAPVRWSDGLRLSLSQPLDSLRCLWRRGKVAQTGKDEAGSSGPALEADGPPGDEVGHGGDPLDAAPTRPWSPQPNSRAARARRHLLSVSEDFQALLDDLDDPKSKELAVRIRLSMTLAELWHLRQDFFELVSRMRDQREAHRRLAQLDRHFPSRRVGL